MTPLNLDLDTIQRALTEAELLQSSPDPLTISAVTADSRAIVPQTLFVAVQGGSADGHTYIPQALSQGAPAIIGSKRIEALDAEGIFLPPNVAYWRVPNPRLALAQIAARLYDNPSQHLAVVGVTGTDGKTTTSTLLEAVLDAATRRTEDEPGDVGVVTTVAARIRGQESATGLHVTTPDAPEVQQYLATMQQADCRYAIIESTSHGLAQERVGAVAFDVAAVTNITHEHLDYHGTRDAYVAAKAKLFRSLYAAPPKPGIARAAVLNGDDVGSYDALLAAMGEEEERTGMTVARRVYGVRPTSAKAKETLSERQLDVCVADAEFDGQHTTFTLHWWGGDFPLATPLIGDFNLYNIGCAATVALVLGVPPQAIQAGVRQMQGVSGRMERIDAGQPFLALVDFAHSPASLERALQTLRPLVSERPNGEPGRLIAIFGSAGLRDQAKRGLMGEVSGRLADITVITAEDPRTEDLATINRAIEAGVLAANSSASYLIEPDRTAAIQAAVDMAEAGDVVASFGKGHERSMCFGTIEYPWSDQDAMRSALEHRLKSSPTIPEKN